MQNKHSSPIPIQKAIYGHLAVSKLHQMLAYDQRIHPAASRVFALIAVHADKDGHCFPSLSAIAKRLGCSRPAISKQVRILKKYGYLESQPRFSDGGQKSNTYILNFSLARKYWDNPWDISLSPMNYIPPVSSRGFGSPKPEEDAPAVTFAGYTKTTQMNKTFEKHEQRKAAHLKAISWSQQQAYAQQTGITAADIKELERVNLALADFYGPTQRTEFDLSVNRLVKSLAPKEQLKEKIRLFWEKVYELQEQKSDSH